MSALVHTTFWGGRIKSNPKLYQAYTQTQQHRATKCRWDSKTNQCVLPSTNTLCLYVCVELAKMFFFFRLLFSFCLCLYWHCLLHWSIFFLLTRTCRVGFFSRFSFVSFFFLAIDAKFTFAIAYETILCTPLSSDKRHTPAHLYISTQFIKTVYFLFFFCVFVWSF